MSFGFSPTDVIKLVEVSTRLYIAFKDANENSEAQVEGLVREFNAFHQCLVELGELMKEYGKSLPFPCDQFKLTLQKCEKTLEPYSENLVDKKIGFKKIYYTIKYIGKEKEIDGLRKLITGHYQALQMCISFLQLRLHLEATKQTQRLLDTAPFRSMSIGSRSYTSNTVGVTSQNTPLALPAPDEHPLYSEWKIFDRWLQREDERISQEAGLARPLSLGDPPTTAFSEDAATTATLYQLRRQVDDAILIEENRTKRNAAEKRTHLSPSDAMKQKVRGMPSAPLRTYTLDTEHSESFSGFNEQDGSTTADHHPMTSSTATIRPAQYSPLSIPSPASSPNVEEGFFGSMDWTHSPATTTMHYNKNNRSSVSTIRSSPGGSPDSRFSTSGLGISTAATTPEHASRPLHHRLSATSLATIALGEGALEWHSLCRKVTIERQSSKHANGKDQSTAESKECDVHWQYREDTGISLRAVYRSSKDGKPRPWTMQHFPATGPSIPLTTTYADGHVSVEFPRASFGKLDKHLTNINYTFRSSEAAEKFQTLLYTNNGAEPAELQFDRPILSISSNKNAAECRGKNVRLWRRSETRLCDDGLVTFDVLVLLFYTSALEDRGHWVEEPHYAFEWLPESCFQKKESDKVTLVFSKDANKWSRDKLFRGRRSSKDTTSSNVPKSPTLSGRVGSHMERRDSSVSFGSGNVGTGTGAASLNRYRYSELSIRFQNKIDRAAFLDVWRRYVKPFRAVAS